MNQPNFSHVANPTDYMDIALKKLKDHFKDDFQNKKGAVTQTILTKIDVIIHNQDKSAVNMFVRRSFSQHLFSWMNDAASRL